MQGKQHLCIHMLYESLVEQCKCTTQPKGSFWCHVIDTKGSMLFSDTLRKNFIRFVSLSFRYVVELKLLQNVKREASCA